VVYSPFSPTHFLTASADWSVRLWSEASPHAIATFQLPTCRDEVADVAFSPASATQFAAAAGSAVQLWDVERSVLAPAGQAVRLGGGMRWTCLAFSRVRSCGTLPLSLESMQHLQATMLCVKGVPSECTCIAAVLHD
jgi:WD40 repeat protein